MTGPLPPLLPPARGAQLLDVITSSADHELMYNIATMQDAGERWGQQLLLGSDWEGKADLTDPAHRALLQKALNR